jgi:hypothetical protein
MFFLEKKKKMGKEKKKNLLQDFPTSSRSVMKHRVVFGIAQVHVCSVFDQNLNHDSNKQTKNTQEKKVSPAQFRDGH